MQRRGAKSDGVRASTESEEVRVGGEMCDPVERRDRCARMEDALCASTVLEYNMWRGAFATGPKT